MIQDVIALRTQAALFLHSAPTAADSRTCTVPCRASHLQGRAMLPDSAVRCPRLAPLMAVSSTRLSQT